MEDLIELIILVDTDIDGIKVREGERVEVDRATAKCLLSGPRPVAARVNGVDPTKKVYIKSLPEAKSVKNKAA